MDILCVELYFVVCDPLFTCDVFCRKETDRAIADLPRREVNQSLSSAINGLICLLLRQ